jgi:hypothetical protein
MTGARPGMTAFDITRHFHLAAFFESDPRHEVRGSLNQSVPVADPVPRHAKVWHQVAGALQRPRVRKLTPSHPDIDAISSYYRTMAPVDVLQWRELPAGEFR